MALKLVVSQELASEALKAQNAGRCYCQLHGPYLDEDEILRGAALYSYGADGVDIILEFVRGFASEARKAA